MHVITTTTILNTLFTSLSDTKLTVKAVLCAKLTNTVKATPNIIPKKLNVTLLLFSLIATSLIFTFKLWYSYIEFIIITIIHKSKY